MDKKAKNNITIGVFVTVGILLFIGFIYFIGSQQSLFGSKVKITAIFKDVAGLQSGNNVRFSGIKIGVVDQIEIASDTTVRVYLLIDKDAGRYIKKDAIASVDSDGLMGNKILSISSGSQGTEAVESGDQIKSKEPLGLEDVITSIKNTSDNARELTSNLNDISEKIKNAEGLLGKVVSDSLLARQVENVVASLEQTGSNAERISREMEIASMQVNKGDGLIGRALYDTTWSHEVGLTLDSVRSAGNNLSASTEELKMFMKKLNDNKGMIDKLMNDSTVAGEFEGMMKNLNKGTENIDDAIETIDNSWLLNLFSGDKEKKEKDQ